MRKFKGNYFRFKYEITDKTNFVTDANEYDFQHCLCEINNKKMKHSKYIEKFIIPIILERGLFEVDNELFNFKMYL